MTVKQMIKRAPKEVVSIFYVGDGFAWYYTKGTLRKSEPANKTGIPYTLVGINEGQSLTAKQEEK
jgi:hypothetical protein